MGTKQSKNRVADTRAAARRAKLLALLVQAREQLLELLARSFHAAVQARNIAGYVLSRHEEEVFIAALLYNVGELAFWGCGGEQVEELPGGSAPDVVTARAVSALGGLLDFTLPLLQGSGELLALKGRSAQDELRKASKKFNRFGVRSSEVVTVGEDLLEEPTTVVRLVL